MLEFGRTLHILDFRSYALRYHSTFRRRYDSDDCFQPEMANSLSAPRGMARGGWAENS